MSHPQLPDERELLRRLGEDSDRGHLAEPEALRRRSDRRTAVRAAVGTVASAVAVLAVVVGANGLTGTAAPDIVGDPTPAPTTPSVSSEVPPEAIPDAAWLGKGDLGFESAGVDELETPALCGQPLVEHELVDAGAFAASGTRLGNYHQPGTPAINTPDGTINQSIVLARDRDSADALMDAIRAAVARCPEETTLDDPGEVTYAVLDGALPTSSARPDRHVLIDVSTSYDPDPEIAPASGPDRYDTFVSVLQVGEAVTILEVRGWEASDTAIEEVQRLAHLATVRLLDWRNG